MFLLQISLQILVIFDQQNIWHNLLGVVYHVKNVSNFFDENWSHKIYLKKVCSISLKVIWKPKVHWFNMTKIVWYDVYDIMNTLWSTFQITCARIPDKLDTAPLASLNILHSCFLSFFLVLSFNYSLRFILCWFVLLAWHNTPCKPEQLISQTQNLANLPPSLANLCNWLASLKDFWETFSFK